MSRNNCSFVPHMASLIWKSDRIIKVHLLTGLMAVPLKTNKQKKEHQEQQYIRHISYELPNSG